MEKRRSRRWLIALGALLVLAVAAYVVFPALVGKREKARSTTCYSDTKQICLALLMYARENDQRLPPADGWQERLLPYEDNPRVFVCQDREDTPTPHFALSPYVTWRRLDEIEAPDTVLMVYEIDATGAPVYPHEGGANYGFADGHVKWFSRTDALKQSWALPAGSGQGE